MGDNPFKPTARGNYTALVMDNNYCSATAANAPMIYAATTITVQPHDTTSVFVGSAAQLSVTTTGDGLTYQWYKNGLIMPSNSAHININGPTLSFTTTSLLDAGNYTVRITGTCGTVTSTIATLIVKPSVVAVELLDFKATPSVLGNLLTWITANELNNKGFQVERRQATGDRWDVLGFVAAKGKAANYDFMDKAPLSGGIINYYRLRQVDNDGAETFSKVVSLSTKSNDKLKTYPNPVSNVLRIETESGDNFYIFNLLGQQVITGKTTQQVDVSALPQGTYLLRVGSEQTKFVKL